MSRSPDESAPKADAAQLVPYRNAWSALSQLIGKGRSFSGYERNCCFLNTQGKAFADVSAATGLDLLDDGRAVALVDWDFDGAVDLWLANRTSPRVRFLRNRLATGHHWIAFRLQGITCNRDAVGARLELYLAGRERPLVRTLRAGDGYLAQSSKWVHFGLGKSQTIERLVVRWPGAEPETFHPLMLDQHYQITQGSGTPQRWSPPADRAELRPADLPAPEPSASRRTWILGQVPLPSSPYLTWEGETRWLDVRAGQGTPLLVSLWSTTCPACLTEFEQWKGHQAQISASGLQILALSVDALATEQSTHSAAQQMLRDLEFPFLSGLATSELVDNLELVQRTFLELQEPLPVPCSFLLDRWGRVASIYKGTVSAEQLVRDVQRLEQSQERQRAAAVPFAGRFASQPFPPQPLAIVRMLDLAERHDDATQYLRDYLALCKALLKSNPRSDSFDAASMRASGIEACAALVERLLATEPIPQAEPYLAMLCELAPEDAVLHRRLAMQLLQRGAARNAISHFALAVKGFSNDPDLLYNYGLAEMGAQQVDNAIELFSRAVQIRDGDAATHFQLATALHLRKKTGLAISHFRRALQQQPDWPLAANNLAWIYATHPRAEYRNAAEAVRLAELACQATQDQDPATLSTLAAAYAEAGRFSDAVRTIRQAVALAAAQKRPQLERRLKERVELFEQGRPYRE